VSLGDVLTIVATTLVGVVAGALSALLGIGGATITTPAVRLLGASPILAVGSTVPAILPGAISGSLRYAREGLVDWSLALSTGIAGSLFALLGAWTSDHVDGRILMLLTAALMLWSGISVMRGRRGSTAAEEEEASSERPSIALLGAVGAGAGFVAGLLGVGGGIVLVPAMTGVLRVPMKRAVASSLVGVAIFSIPALVTHAVLGHIDWSYALPLMFGVVPGARLGARFTLRQSDRSVRRIFGLMVIVLALVYGGSELAAML
jgi:uncharacterized membrane protein YfcA